MQKKWFRIIKFNGRWRGLWAVYWVRRWKSSVEVAMDLLAGTACSATAAAFLFFADLLALKNNNGLGKDEIRQRAPRFMRSELMFCTQSRHKNQCDKSPSLIKTRYFLKAEALRNDEVEVAGGDELVALEDDEAVSAVCLKQNEEFEYVKQLRWPSVN